MCNNTIFKNNIDNNINYLPEKMSIVTLFGTTIQQQNLYIDHKYIQRVLQFLYLGIFIPENNDKMMEIQRRINLANKAYFGFTNIMKFRSAHRKTKILF